MQAIRLFEATFIGATEHRGNRTKIKDLRYNKTIILSYDYKFNSPKSQAAAHLSATGIEVQFEAEAPDAYLLGTTNFDTMLTK